VAAALTAVGLLGCSGVASKPAVGLSKPVVGSSGGCGGAGRSLVPGQEKVTITSGGTPRWYLRHVPPAYDGSHPVPLVVDLHGYSEGAEIQALLSGLGPFGDRNGFMTVTPQGSGAVVGWNVAATSADMVFIGDLLDSLERGACVDTHRIFVTGISNGAMMTSAVACAYSARVAAIAPVAGVTAITPCALKRPVPVIAFHGTADGYLLYAGGLGPKALALPAPAGSGRTLGQVGVQAAGPSVPQVMGTWAARDGCGTAPTSRAVAGDVTLISYPCRAGVGVELYRIQGGGHAWPGSLVSAAVSSSIGHTTMSISADALIWAFFRSHPLGA
jgi:polyhydroxybutyrate depolymerase